MQTETDTKKRILHTKAAVRRFALTVGLVFVALGAILWWREKPLWPYLGGLGGVLIVTGLIAPNLLAPVERAWTRFARALGTVSTTVILALTFYLLMTPMGLLLRLFRKDPLTRRFDKRAGSYWAPVGSTGPTTPPDKPY